MNNRTKYLGPYELNQIYLGDAFDLAKEIPDDSVDLIIADPIYQNIDDYHHLAKLAARVLKRGGNLLVQTGQYYLPEIILSMNGFLDWVWLIAEWGLHSAIYVRRIRTTWKPYLWYSKGQRTGDWILDWIKGGGPKSLHKWEDSPKMFVTLIERLTQPDSIVLDPFTGTGTIPIACKLLGRSWLAFELNAELAGLARQRIISAQEPLFLHYEQSRLFATPI